MSTEQERADFEAWALRDRIAYRDEKRGVCFYNGERNSYWIGYQAGRAALQSQSNESAARELALWAYGEVGADPELTPGLAQLLHHFGISDDVPAALHSQDKEDADRLQAMAAEWDRARRGVDSHMPIWENLCEAIGADADGAGMREAIDHARRIEGEL